MLEYREDKGEMDMCKALDDWYQDGVNEGEERIKRIFKLYIEGKTVEEIAGLCNVTVQKVEDIRIKVLNRNSPLHL